MYKIKHITSNTEITVATEPHWSGGIWDCGDQRFVDADKAIYEPVAPVLTPPTIPVIEFKLLFTAQERVVINAARATDPVIEDFYKLLDDPRTTVVNLSLPAVQDMIGYLALQNLITAERKAVILAYRP